MVWGWFKHNTLTRHFTSIIIISAPLRLSGIRSQRLGTPLVGYLRALLPSKFSFVFFTRTSSRSCKCHSTCLKKLFPNNSFSITVMARGSVSWWLGAGVEEEAGGNEVNWIQIRINTSDFHFTYKDWKHSRQRHKIVGTWKHRHKLDKVENTLETGIRLNVKLLYPPSLKTSLILINGFSITSSKLSL